MQAPVTTQEHLDRRIATGEAQVCVIGLGTVGLPQLEAAAEAGFRAVGIDASEAVVDRVRTMGGTTLNATTDFDAVRDSDCVLICVPTAWSRETGPDLSAVVSAVREVSRRLLDLKLIILESTVPPGTTRELVLPLLESGGSELGPDFHLAFGPERLDPGNRSFSVRDIAKVVGGVTEACTNLAARFYSRLGLEVHPVSSPEVAEATKVFENVFRFVNIGLANELAQVCESLGVSPWEVLDAAGTKPFGFLKHSPGPGVGGRCIPMASRFFRWTARRHGASVQITDAAIAVNDNMPEIVAKETLTHVRQTRGRQTRPLVLIIGMAYKPGVGDVRGSVALSVARRLIDAGVHIEYHDPLVPIVDIGGEPLASVPLTEESIRSADCTLILCPQEEVDYDAVRQHSRHIIDPTGTLPQTAVK
jgi:UDP-N-acetyl-D-glucosamine dehydrogenase